MPYSTIAIILAGLLAIVLIMLAMLNFIECLSKRSAKKFDDEQQYDCFGNPVDYLITFEEFVRDYASSNIHDFDSMGFLYDESGAYGLPDCPVGFETKRDAVLYRRWLRQSNIK